MMKKCFRVSIILLTLINLNCENKIIEGPGPNLKGKVSVIFKLINQCPENNLIKEDVKYGVKIKNICSQPIFADEDYKSIKLIWGISNKTKVYHLSILFNNPEKLKSAIKTKGYLWAYYVNDQLRGIMAMASIVDIGIFYFGHFSEKEIIELIGAETFKQYQTVWKSSSEK